MGFQFTPQVPYGASLIQLLVRVLQPQGDLIDLLQDRLSVNFIHKLAREPVLEGKDVPP